MEASTIARKAKNFKHWMLLPPVDQHIVLAVYFKATKKRNYYNSKVPRKKAFLIQVRQFNLASDCFTVKHTGYDLTLNYHSRKQSLRTNNLDSAIRKAASFYHKKMHKKDEKYKIAAEFYLNEIIEDNWLDLTGCLPCQAPYIQLEDESTVDLELYDRLSLLEL